LQRQMRTLTEQIANIQQERALKNDRKSTP